MLIAHRLLGYALAHLDAACAPADRTEPTAEIAHRRAVEIAAARAHLCRAAEMLGSERSVHETAESIGLEEPCPACHPLAIGLVASVVDGGPSQ